MNIYNKFLPYTYLIEWMNGVRYYGVRYAKNCHPNDLWVTYFSSSKYVLEHIKHYGQPSKITIRRTFCGPNAVKNARNWEHKVLRRLRVISRSDYLNKTDNKAFDNTDLNLETIRKQKVAMALSTPKTKKLLSDATKKSWENPNIRNKRVASQRKQSVIDKKRKFNSSRTGENASNVDLTIYTFVHETGIIEHCMRSELIKKYKLNNGNICTLIKGNTNRTKHKGWSVIN